MTIHQLVRCHLHRSMARHLGPQSINECSILSSGLLIDLMLYKLDLTFIRRLCLPVALSIIRWRIQQFDPYTSKKILKLLWNKDWALICSNHPGNPKYVYYVLLHKSDHIFRSHVPLWHNFDTLHEVICCRQYVFVPLARRWVNLADHIDSPSFQRPRLDDRIHSWRPHSLDWPKLWAILASFIVSEIVFKYCCLEITCSPQQLHLVGRLMSPTYTFVDLAHH